MQLRRRRDDHKRAAGGAEMVEFAFVVVLLIALLYGIISYGLILGAQATITQAAADGGVGRIVVSSTGGSIGPPCTTSACTVSESQARERHRVDGQGNLRVPPARPSPACPPKRPARPTPVNECLTLTVSYKLRREPALSRAPRHGGHHTVDDLVEQHTLQISTPSS